MQLPGVLLAVAVLAGSYPARAQVRWLLMQLERVVEAGTYVVATVQGRARLRLLGTDAPELSQPFGRQAAEQVAALVLRRYLWAQVRGLDAFRRNLAAVQLRPAAYNWQGPVALNSLLVVRGWAWAYDSERAVAPRATQQQQAAQAARRGL